MFSHIDTFAGRQLNLVAGERYRTEKTERSSGDAVIAMLRHDATAQESDRQARMRKLRAVSGLASLCSQNRLEATDVLAHMEPPEWYDFDSEEGLLDFAIDAGAAIQMVLDERFAILGTGGTSVPGQAPPWSANRLSLRRRLQHAS
jgi:hypothetical protein